MPQHILSVPSEPSLYQIIPFDSSIQANFVRMRGLTPFAPVRMRGLTPFASFAPVEWILFIPAKKSSIHHSMSSIVRKATEEGLEEITPALFSYLCVLVLYVPFVAKLLFSL